MPIPENNVRFTDLSNGTVKAGSIFATSEPDSSTPPSYDSTKVTAQAVGNFVATSQTYSGLSTVAKTLVGAINEAAQGGGGGASSLNDLTDVTINLPTTGQTLQYVSGVWRNRDATASVNFEVYEDEDYGTGDEIIDVAMTTLLVLIQDPNYGNVYIKTLAADGINYDFFPYLGEIIGATPSDSVIFFGGIQDDNGRLVLKIGMGTVWEEDSNITKIDWTVVPLQPLEVSGTLTAGSTSITLSDAAITASSTIDIYTDTYGVNPTAVTVSTGSVTMTFESQANNVSVKVRIS